MLELLDSIAAVSVRYNGSLLQYGTDYTVAEGDNLINFTHTLTGTFVISYNAPLNNRGAAINFTRGPPLAATLNYDDTILVNVNADQSETHANGIGALLSIDGQHGSDHTIVYFANAPYSSTYPISTINVHDSGAPAGDGLNKLDIYGTDNEDVGDNFLLRRNFVALLPSGGTAERVNYDYTQTRGLEVFGRRGDDHFTLDDNSVITTIDGGEGDDVFQVGQIFQSTREIPKIPATAADDVFDTVETTRGFLSNGISFDTSIYGDQGRDSFTVFHNLANLNLDGGSGDDTFSVRAFALKGSQAIDPNQRATSVFGGLGNDFVEYTDNAPVNIDGGAGTDTVVVIGTEFSDTFVVTRDGVYGAGLFVQMIGIEILKVNGQEGNDTFVVLSTNPAVSTTLYGDLGSDTFDVGGNFDGSPIVVSSRDLQGHNGLIAQAATTTDVAYANAVIRGISASVADNDTAAAVVTPLGPMRVYEGGTGTAAYSVVLTQAPVGGNVYVNIAPSELSADDQAAGALPLAFLVGGVLSPALVLTFTASNWYIPQTVYVVAQDDHVAQGVEKQVDTPVFSATAGQTTYDLGVSPLRLEDLTVNGARYHLSHATLSGSVVTFHNLTLNAGDQVVITYVMPDGAITLDPIKQSISGASAANYLNVVMANVVVQRVDNDGAAVVTTQTDPVSHAQDDSTIVIEGGLTDGYDVSLSFAPTATVTVTLTTDSSRLTLSASTLTFTTADWATVRHITVTAVDDSLVQGEQFVTIHHAVSSADVAYNGLSVPDLIVTVEDNDIGGVLVRESGGSTHVIEVDPTLSTAFTAPFIDSYTVVLTKAPTAPVTIHITPSLTETGGTVTQTLPVGVTTFTLAQAPRGGLVTKVLVDGNRLARTDFHLAADGQTLVITAAGISPTAVIQVTYQVDHSSVTVAVSQTGLAGSFSTTGFDLTFTTSNWNVAQTVWVAAVDNSFIDGDAVRTFASQPRTLAPIQGPLDIEGGADPSGVGSIPPPLLYLHETDPQEFVPDPNSNFSALEPQQVDVLQALNTDSLANATGVLDDQHLTGFGMGGNRVIGGSTYAGGITYHDVELLRLDTGNGSDNLTINQTHGTVTVVNAEQGNDQIFVRNIAGPTTINGQEGNDTVSIGTSPGSTIDRIRGLLRVVGGSGTNTVNVDDSGDVTNDVAIITGSTVDGMDFATSPVLTYSIVNATGGTYTLTIAGLTTAPLAYLAGAAAVKAAVLALGIPNVSDVVVNRAGDTFTLGFVGGETMATSFTISTDASHLTFVLGRPASMSSSGWAQSLTQTLDVHATTGTFTVTVGAPGHSATFQFSAGITSADQFRDALITALHTIAGIPVAADGPAVGVKDVLVDKVGTAYLVTYLGLLRGTIGDAYNLSVPPNSSVSGSDVTVNAVGGTFTLGTTNPRTAPARPAPGRSPGTRIADIAAALSTLYGVAVTVTGDPGPTQRVLHITGPTPS